MHAFIYIIIRLLVHRKSLEATKSLRQVICQTSDNFKKLINIDDYLNKQNLWNYGPSLDLKGTSRNGKTSAKLSLQALNIQFSIMQNPYMWWLWSWLTFIARCSCGSRFCHTSANKSISWFDNSCHLTPKEYSSWQNLKYGTNKAYEHQINLLLPWFLKGNRYNFWKINKIK